jgi:hypothetical protein
MTNKLFVGAAAIATLAPFGTASPSSADAALASNMVGGRVIAVDDDGNSINEQGQTSGDIFTQNAQDQSTA